MVGAARGRSDRSADQVEAAGIDPIEPRTKETGSERGAARRQWSEACARERVVDVADVRGIAAQAEEVACAVEVTGDDNDLAPASPNAFRELPRLERVSIAPGEHGRLVVRVHDEDGVAAHVNLCRERHATLCPAVVQWPDIDMLEREAAGDDLRFPRVPLRIGIHRNGGDVPRSWRQDRLDLA